ncbi:MAG TPA: DUF222 domain-containing protein [Streptosporangiaceae bacterium]|nr:DUF222 domain-containing protein [Streptosporangiaceae bacterium]
MSTVPAPVSTAEAIAMVLTGLRHLAVTDPTAMAPQAQAECLQALEQAAAMSTAARAGILAAFTASQGYAADADYSPTSWLIHRTRITKGAARGHRAWARRAAAHPRVVAALAEGTVLTESMAALICLWTGKLPESCREAADDILVTAAGAGARKEDLAGLAAEVYARSLPDPQDDDPQLSFEDRQLRVETTFAGAGVITGDLSPECAAVTAVLDALSAPAGVEDTRTREQRYHDALEDAMRRLVAAGLLPERAGQPVKVWAHISLAELRALDDGSVLQQEWIGEMAVRWAARRAAASQTGSDGAAWLDGKAARAVACDATLIPVVTGGIDPAALDDLVTLCLKYAGHGPHCGSPGHANPAGSPAGSPASSPAAAGSPDPAAQPGPGGPARPARGPGRTAPAHRSGAGDAPPRDHRHGRRPGLRPRRPGVLPAHPPVGRPAGRTQPAAGRRPQRGDPRRDPPRGDPAGPALPLGRRILPLNTLELCGLGAAWSVDMVLQDQPAVDLAAVANSGDGDDTCLVVNGIDDSIVS